MGWSGEFFFLKKNLTENHYFYSYHQKNAKWTSESFRSHIGKSN